MQAFWGAGRHPYKQAYIQTHIHTVSQTHIHTYRQSHIHLYSGIHTGIYTGRQPHSKSVRYTDTQGEGGRERHRDRDDRIYRDRYRYSLADWRTGRQAEWQAGRPTYRDIKTY